MNKSIFNKRAPLRFKHFSRKGHSLFACLGREVLIGTLSAATLTNAKADGMSTHQLSSDTLGVSREVNLAEVSVTGSRAPLAVSQQARVVCVLEKADIQAMPAQSVNDLLKGAIGVDVRQRGPLGAQTDVSIRGGTQEQIAVLLNGISICDPQTGHNAFDLPVDICDIERIEILEGPAGRAFATTSLLGAINIITSKTHSTQAQVHARAGSYGYADVGGRAEWAAKVGNSISATYQRSDGYSRNSQGGLNADYRSTKAFYEGNFDNESLRLNWHAGISNRDFGSNTFYGARWDNQFEHTLKTFTALQAENKRGRLHLRPAVYWNRNHDRFELFRNDADAYPFNYHRTDVVGASLNAYLDWMLGRTALGLEVRSEDLISTNLGEPLDKPRHIGGTSQTYAYGLKRTNTSMVLEHHLLLGRLTLSAAAVATRNSWNQNHVRLHPGIDAAWQLSDAWKLFATFNTAIRMPSVTELYYSVGGHKADKHLKPEELSALEAGARYTATGISIGASVYRNHCRNIIDWIRDTTLGEEAEWQSANFAKVNAIGLEASAALDLRRLWPQQRVLSRFSIAYSYIWQDKLENEGIQSQFTLEYLRHKLVASTSMQLSPNLEMGIFYRLQSRMGTYTDADGAVKPYKCYSLIDARLTYNRPHYALYVEANNLLNTTYVDFGHIPQPGIWLMAGGSLRIAL